VRRLVTGSDSSRGGAATLRQPDCATAGAPTPPVPDAVPTLTGLDSQTFTGHTDGGQTLTDFVDPDAVAPTLNGTAQSTAQAGTGGLSGHDGGVNTLGKGAGGGLDDLGKTSLTGPDASGFGGAEPLSEAPQTSLPDPPSQVQADSDVSADAGRPSDYHARPPTEADFAAKVGHGGSIGGGQGSDVLARGLSPSGSELASAPSAPAAPVDSGLGGVHGGGSLAGDGSNVLGRSPIPANLPSGGVDLAGLPAGTGPGDLGVQGGLGGHQGVGEPLARGPMPDHGGPFQSVAGTVTTPDAPLPEAGPAWLAPGALARAGSLDWDDDRSDSQPTTVFQPLTRTYTCPSCRRNLPFGPRFCGYCGEPLDRTIA
jgi:hypothetical protein